MKTTRRAYYMKNAAAITLAALAMALIHSLPAFPGDFGLNNSSGAKSAMKLAGSIMAENQIIVEAPAAPAEVSGQPVNYCPSCDWPRYSKDYDEIHSNNDGSTTIINPAFGGQRRLAEGSSLDHACRDFGFGAAQAFIPQYRRGDPAVEIDSRGNRKNLPSGEYWIVHYLTCSMGPASMASTPGVEDRCEKTYQNSDGSFTILKPFVKAEGRGKMAISWSSDGPGVCRYFGFSRYVTSRLDAGIFTRTVVIGSEGRITKTIGSGGGDFHADNPRYYDNSGLEFIVCK